MGLVRTLPKSAGKFGLEISLEPSGDSATRPSTLTGTGISCDLVDRTHSAAAITGSDTDRFGSVRRRVEILSGQARLLPIAAAPGVSNYCESQRSSCKRPRASNLIGFPITKLSRSVVLVDLAMVDGIHRADCAAANETASRLRPSPTLAHLTP